MSLQFPQTAKVHGKLIISGEHAVVYGYSALVIESPVWVIVTVQEGESRHSGYEAMISRVFEIYTQVTLPPLIITSHGSLPQKSSFGSSASFALGVLTCLMNAYGMKFSKEELFNLVYECEKYAHGNPSGVDPASVVYGGVVEFWKKDGIPCWEQRNISVDFFQPTLLIQSGPAEESTKEMIEVASRHPRKDSIFSQIGVLTNNILLDAKVGKFNRQYIQENERLLEELGVVSHKALTIIQKIEEFGGVAKITGGGGRRIGSGVILVYHDDERGVKEFVGLHGWNTIPKE